MTIAYRAGNDLDLDAVIALYRDSTLGERRPVDARGTMAAMLANASLVVSAWADGALVGIARTLTDHAYVAYLADLAVARAWQRQGIGSRLVAETRSRLGPGAMLVLLAAPAAADYYPRLGFSRHPSAWVLKPGEPLAEA